jgi:hypothetical protein
VNRGGNTKYNALVPRIIPGGEGFFNVKEIMVVLYFLDSLKSKDRVEKY